MILVKTQISTFLYSVCIVTSSYSNREFQKIMHNVSWSQFEHRFSRRLNSSVDIWCNCFMKAPLSLVIGAIITRQFIAQSKREWAEIHRRIPLQCWTNAAYNRRFDNCHIVDYCLACFSVLCFTLWCTNTRHVYQHVSYCCFNASAYTSSGDLL